MSRLGAIADRLPEGAKRLVRRLPGFRAVTERAAGRPGGPAPARGALRPVVYPPTWLRWDQMVQRPQYLLRALAGAGHDVHFVDLTEAAPRGEGGVAIWPDLRALPATGVIGYVHYAPAAAPLRNFGDSVVVYDLLDDLSLYRGPDEHRVRRDHPRLMADADVVIAASAVLAERHRHERDDIVLLRNGVDAARFAAPAPRPGDLPTGRPTAGYVGAIDHWFDFTAVAAVARRLPDWGIVLVGPVRDRVADAAQRLAQCDNVTLLGEKPAPAVPGYVQAFDVGMIPFVVDAMTEAVEPLKMHEYLAAGTPVAASSLPACREHPLVDTVDDGDWADGVLRAAGRAARDGFATTARTAAAEADWNARLEPLVAALDGKGLRTWPR